MMLFLGWKPYMRTFEGWAKRIVLSSLLLLLMGLFSACQVDEMNQWQSFVVAAGLTPSPMTTAISTPLPTAEPTVTATPVPAPVGIPPLDLRTTENILILGTDTQMGEAAWRTDAIMILGLDYQYRRAALLSIPRDLLVDIPGIGQRRINQVDYLGERVLKTEGGGPALFSTVLSDTLGLQTEHWIRADMNGFRSFVDIIGGVTVRLDCPYYELYRDDNTGDYFWYSLPAGDVVMDGETAFMFVRLRYINTDSGRSMRQRQFLWALREQAMSTNLLPKLPELWRLMRDNFNTDLSLFQILELGNFGLSLDAADVRAGAITVKDLERYITSSGADVLRINDPARIQAIIDGIWDAPPLSAAGTTASGVCPPPPSNLPDYLVLDVPTPTPEEMEIAATEPISDSQEVAVTADTAAEPLTEAAPQSESDPVLITDPEPAPVSALAVEPGMKVEIINTGGRSIRLRSLPGVNSEVLDAYWAGEVLEILVPGDDYARYPVEQDGYGWVRVSAWDGRIGWIAQRYLGPVDGEAGSSPQETTSTLPEDATTP